MLPESLCRQHSRAGPAPPPAPGLRRRPTAAARPGSGRRRTLPEPAGAL